DDADALFEAIANERGGLASFSTVQITLARRAAQQLAGDGGDPKDIVALLSLLPPVVPRADAAVPAAVWDLSLLNDDQLLLLEQLQACATGKSWPSRCLTSTFLLAHTIDATDVDALPPGERADLVINLRNMVGDVVGSTALMAEMFRCYGGGDRTAEVAELKTRIELLERENHMLRSKMSGKVAS